MVKTYHSRHSRAELSKEVMMFLKLGSLSSSVRLSQAASEIQSAHGFAGCSSLLKTWFSLEG